MPFKTFKNTCTWHGVELGQAGRAWKAHVSEFGQIKRMSCQRSWRRFSTRSAEYVSRFGLQIEKKDKML